VTDNCIECGVDLRGNDAAITSLGGVCSSCVEKFLVPMLLQRRRARARSTEEEEDAM
jgi:hypothetical protein